MITEAQMIERMEKQIIPLRELVAARMEESEAIRWLRSLEQHKCKCCGNIGLWDLCMSCINTEEGEI